MSAMELRNFENQLELLSYTELLAMIEYSVKLLQKRNENTVEEAGGDNWLSETFAFMDANPVYSNGVKWSREELYER